jgi:hypothetical protein
MFVKQSEWTMNFLQRWWDETTFIDQPYYPDKNSDNNAIVDKNRGGYFYDQSALHYMWDHYEDCRKNIKIMPDCWFNSRDKIYNPKDFSIHFAGGGPQKEQRVRQFLKKHLPFI